MNLPLSFVAIHLEKLKPILWSKWNFIPKPIKSNVICPARIDAKVAEKLEQLLYMYRKIYVGLLAVEMFQTEDDEILVNEVALSPTIQVITLLGASYTSQFENHVRAILTLQEYG
jgi:phosphoribosylaminoimidazole carboxylase (NCAIR synthetase)